MPGNQTQRFDAVMEFTEQSINDVLSTFFDSGGLLSDFLTGVGLGSADGAFSLDVLFDRPSDVPIPNSSRNVIDMRFDIGNDGSLGQLRAVVGLIVNRTDSDDFDIVEVDLENQLHFTGFTAGGIPIPLLPNLFADFLRNDVKVIPLVPVPVKRDAEDPADLPTKGDIQIIDDRSGEDRDALAVMLTFAGGASGTASDLQNFVNPEENGALAVFFGWLARILKPRLADALETDEDNFDVGDDFLKLNKAISAPGDSDGAKLTKLELTLKDGFIELKGKITKSGFCYEAEGKVTGRIRIAVEEGELVFNAEFDDPDVDVDIPYYCYLVGALVGIVTGGLVGVLVGAVVGAVGGAVVGGTVGGAIVGGIVGAILIGILVPVLMAIAENVLEASVEGIAGSLANKLNQDLTVPAIGLNLVFQRVFIDDIDIHFDAVPIEKVPIRSSGTLVVRNGQLIDLDNGLVGGESLAGVDLEWSGRGNGRHLRTRCGTSLARTRWSKFSRILRWKLYPLGYASATIPLSELAIPQPFANLPFFNLPETEEYAESRLVYAVKTAEGRFSVIQVAEVFNDRIVLRYKTYEKPLPSVQLFGEFECNDWHIPGVLQDLKSVRFEKSPRQKYAPWSPKQQAVTRTRLGRWRGDFIHPTSKVGHFRAVVEKIAGDPSYHWHVAGTDLIKNKGTVLIGGKKASYEIDKEHLTLKLQNHPAQEFFVKVTVNDAIGNALTASKCVKYDPVCKKEVGVIPPVKTQVAAFHEHFAVVRLPLAVGNAHIGELTSSRS